RQLDLLLLCVAYEGDLDGLARARVADNFDQVVVGRDGFVVDLGDAVADLEASLLGGAVGSERCEDGTRFGAAAVFPNGTDAHDGGAARGATRACVLAPPRALTSACGWLVVTRIRAQAVLVIA